MVMEAARLDRAIRNMLAKGFAQRAIKEALRVGSDRMADIWAESGPALPMHCRAIVQAMN